ncbi:extra spindle pole bodies 1 [Perkinsus chesapeaki]|uniref:separase n=1 Tax=Perkinsus chesapeaki TaxID=330153 RepID=A0A7J6MMW6_PERCH|nr:extra spindle pole bodies 1 [Perkinsus chesapeaki]
MSHMPEGDSLNELREALESALESRGTMGKLRARLRAEVFDVLCGGGGVAEGKEKVPQPPRENVIINELIREYFEFNGYHHSLATFVAESGTPEERPFTREVLEQETGINPSVAEAPLPLIYKLVPCSGNRDEGSPTGPDRLTWNECREEAGAYMPNEEVMVTVEEMLAELARASNGSDVGILVRKITDVLPKTPLSSKERRALCKAVHLKPGGLRLRLRTLAAGKTENEPLEPLDGALLAARIAQRLSGDHATDLISLGAVVAAPVVEGGADKEEVFTVFSRIIAEELSTSTDQGNIITNIIRLRTVARSATGDRAVLEAVEAPLRAALGHDEAAIQLAAYDLARLIAQMSRDFILSSMHEPGLSKHMKILMCSVLLSRVSLTETEEASATMSKIVDLITETTGVDSTIARDIQVLESKRSNGKDWSNLAKLVYHVASPWFMLSDSDLTIILAGCVVLNGPDGDSNALLATLKSSLYHHLHACGNCYLQEDSWLPHLTDFSVNLWSAESIRDLKANVLADEPAWWERPKLLLAVLEWLYCRDHAAVLRSAVGLKLLRLLRWPPVNVSDFTNGSSSLSRQLFGDDAIDSGAWKVMAAYKAALLTGVAHDDTGSKKGALFFYQKAAECPHLTVRSVAEALLTSITDECAGDAMPEIPSVARERATERDLQEATHAYWVVHETKPKLTICPECLRRVLALLGSDTQRSDCNTNRRRGAGQDCCSYIAEMARLIATVRASLEKAVVESQSAWLARKGGGLLLSLLGDISLCKVSKHDRQLFSSVVAKAAITAVSWSSRAFLFMLTEYRVSERSSENNLPAFLDDRLAREKLLVRLCTSQWADDIDTQHYPVALNSAFIEQDHLGRFWLLRRFPWGRCLLALLSASPEAVLRAAGKLEQVVSDNMADVRLAVQSKQDGHKFWRSRDNYEARAWRATERIRKELLGDWRLLLTIGNGDCASPEASLDALDDSSETTTSRKAREMIRAALEFDIDEGSNLDRSRRASALFLFLAPCLMNLPIEAMLGGQHPTVRGGCINLMVQSHPMAAGKGGYYVLDPSADLTKANRKLDPILAHEFWEGKAGTDPSIEEVIKALSSRRVFLYIGHSGGGQYWSTSSMEKRILRADALLMGCASIRCSESGIANGRFEPIPPAYYYMVGGSAHVVGTLWEVLGRECDSFCIELLQKWRVTSSTSPVHEEGVFDLPVSIALARESVKLELLSGGAFVCYAGRLI